jgi:hypothetical protein
MVTTEGKAEHSGRLRTQHKERCLRACGVPNRCVLSVGVLDSPASSDGFTHGTVDLAGERGIQRRLARRPRSQ